MNWFLYCWKLFGPRLSFGVFSGLSGYQGDEVAVVFSGTQQIDSLLDNEYTDLSDEIQNGQNNYPQMDLSLVLGSAAFTGTDSAIEIYIIVAVDGTNYPDWDGNTATDAQENNKYFRRSLTTTGSTAVQRIDVENVSMPQGNFKFAIRSRAGVTLNAAGNDLYYRPHGFASK